MNSFIEGRSGAGALLLLLLFAHSAAGQLLGDECLAQFKKGKEDFVLDADESVKDGATFLSSPKLTRHKDCVTACCKQPRCNVAFMERGSEEGLINSCFLFDCLYKQKYVCRFVRKKGYDSYVLNSLYESHLDADLVQADDTPPVADGGPDQVVQPQDRVTLNGIQSKDDNKIESFKWKMLTEYPFVVFEEAHFKDQMIVSNLTSGVYKFQLTVTDSIGQSDTTQVRVLVLTPEESEHHCMAPKKVGPCRSAFPRWHYNAASEKCEQFTFGGCRGNRNNYLSEDECSRACYGAGKNSKEGRGLPIPTPTGEKCDAPCTAEQFTCDNGCCLDQGLECDSSPQCSDNSDENNCDELKKTFRILTQIPVDEQKVRCTEHPDTGTCRDSITKWYYSPYEEACLRFNYGGCHGNENKFDSEESCLKVCRGVTKNDIFGREGYAKPRNLSESQTSIVAIAIALGVAIAILLGVMLYCLIKGKKSQRQHVLVNSAPVIYRDDKDHLVYNNTTKPI